jgi:hypothetical protein
MRAMRVKLKVLRVGRFPLRDLAVSPHYPYCLISNDGFYLSLNIERTKNVNTKYKMPRKPRGGAILGAIPAVDTLYDQAEAFQRAITNDTLSGERRKMVKSNNDSAMASAMAENQVADVKAKSGGSHKSQHIKYMLGHLKERNKGYVKPFEPFRPNMVKRTENSPFIKNLQKAHTAPSPKAPAKRGKKVKAEPVAEEAPAPSAPVDKKSRAIALKAEGLSTRAIAKKMVEEGYTKVSPSTVVNLLKGSGFIADMKNLYEKGKNVGTAGMAVLKSLKQKKEALTGSGYDEHPEDFFF